MFDQILCVSLSGVRLEQQCACSNYVILTFVFLLDTINYFFFTKIVVELLNLIWEEPLSLPVKSAEFSLGSSLAML